MGMVTILGNNARSAMGIEMDTNVKPIIGNSYELRLCDATLLTFTLSERGVSLIAEISGVSETASHLLPLDLTLTNDGIINWLRHRVIPKNRAFVEEILKSLGLSLGNTKGIIDACKGLSLNDSYWVVPSGFSGSFSEYNLYENEFSEILSLVAYTGIGQSNHAVTNHSDLPFPSKLLSPELTTGGMLPKAWHRLENGEIHLFKGGTSGAVNTGNEPFSEFYACQIARVMGLDAVTYDLEYWKDILASRCKLFTDINTAYIPIGRLVRSGGLQACLDFCDRLGEDHAQAVRSMLVFDAVIYNEDRHFGNFGVLRENRTGNIIAPAPIFDNGQSLFNFAMTEDLANLDEYAKTRFPAYGDISFERICGEVMGETQAKQLRRLIGFTFTRHASINWPEERLDAVERHLQRRVRQLLG